MSAATPRTPNYASGTSNVPLLGDIVDVHVVDEFPMTVTGKVRKVDMREQAVDILAAAR
ncbi:hypothetical protein [Haloechinothrix salitolerans]|uniref:Uncharacterized protein n=1 Tax=Haloechinothrix salitolerans TaxID=926830 RepID=A0ABW2BWV1_9PSEU